ncbi:MAG: SGNH/GDSL hydrolase family protein [Ginsengibacter sp.]
MKFPSIFILILMVQTASLQAQDWPNLERYRNENKQLAPPIENENRVVFMGNSITEGWIQKDPEFFENKPYINRGISGQTTPQMLLRFQQDVIALKPKVVIILAGINDIAGNTGPSTLEMIENNIASMAVLAKASGIHVVLSSVLPAYDFPWSPGKQPADKVITLNKWIKDFSEKNRFVYLDYFSSMADDRNGLMSKYTVDGIHPTLAGYKIMEPLVEKAIRAAFKKSK